MKISNLPTMRVKVENPSGIYPTEYKVLIKPKDVGKFHEFTGADGKKYKLEKPDEVADRQQFAATEGTIVAVSPLAFTYANETEWAGTPKPKAGDRVIYAKYAGALVTGKDGAKYQLTNDKDVVAVLS